MVHSNGAAAPIKGEAVDLEGRLAIAPLGSSSHGSSRSSGRGGTGAYIAAWADPQVLLRDAVRAVLQFTVSGLAFLLMLAAMSFNVSIFFAVIVGMAVGAFLFGRARSLAALIEPPDAMCGH